MHKLIISPPYNSPFPVSPIKPGQLLKLYPVLWDTRCRREKNNANECERLNGGEQHITKSKRLMRAKNGLRLIRGQRTVKDTKHKTLQGVGRHGTRGQRSWSVAEERVSSFIQGVLKWAKTNLIVVSEDISTEISCGILKLNT